MSATLEDDGELVFERGWIGVGVRSEALQLSPNQVSPLGRVKVANQTLPLEMAWSGVSWPTQL